MENLQRTFNYLECTAVYLMLESVIVFVAYFDLHSFKICGKTARCFSVRLANAKECKNEQKNRIKRGANSDGLPYTNTCTRHKQPWQQSQTFHVSVEIGAGIVLSVWLLTE